MQDCGCSAPHYASFTKQTWDKFSVPRQTPGKLDKTTLWTLCISTTYIQQCIIFTGFFANHDPSGGSTRWYDITKMRDFAFLLSTASAFVLQGLLNFPHIGPHGNSNFNKYTLKFFYVHLSNKRQLTVASATVTWKREVRKAVDGFYRLLNAFW